MVGAHATPETEIPPLWVNDHMNPSIPDYVFNELCFVHHSTTLPYVRIGDEVEGPPATPYVLDLVLTLRYLNVNRAPDFFPP